MASGRALVLGSAVLSSTAACVGILGIDDPPPVARADAAAAPAPDGATARFCDQDASFCADFEDAEESVVNGWTQQRGPVTRVTDLVASGTGAARGALVDAGVCSYADLRESMPGPYHRAHLELSLRRSASDGTAAHGSLFTIGGGVSLTDASTQYCVFIFNFDGEKPDVQIQHGEGDSKYPYDLDPDAGAFVPFSIDLDDETGTTHAVIRANGATVVELTKDNAPLLAACALGGPIDVSVGLYCDNGNDDVRFDDVLLRVE